MKTTILTLLAACCITPCSTPADTERLQRVGDIALSYAERTGKISPEDAALAREAGQLLISKGQPAAVATSGK